MESLNTSCPVCEAEIPVEGITEDAEILYCWDCSSRLMANFVANGTFLLNEAPMLEDDWEQ